MRLEITIDYGDAETANVILSSVAPDNGDFVLTESKGGKIRFIIVSDNIGTVRSTADDLLACVKIAEESSFISGPAPDLDGDAFLE